MNTVAEMSGSRQEPPTKPLDQSTVQARTLRELVWRRFRSDRLAIVALVTIVVIVFCAIFAAQVVGLVGGRPPNQGSTKYLNEFGAPTGPTSVNIFGVDTLGRDIFSRVIYGARMSLLIAFLATAIGVCVGTAAGTVAGYYGGWIDSALSRTLDVALAFPLLLLAFGLSASCGTGNGCVGGTIQPGVGLVVGLLALASFPYVARLIRGQVLSIRSKEFVEASKAIGSSNRRIIFTHVLPNLIGPILVYATFMVPTNILLEAGLSYLGVGIQPPTASWGSMIAEASSVFRTAWWFMLFPGIALLITVLAFNLVGEALHDAIQPNRSRNGRG
jgi:peptide/nickel transport system permease protein